MCPLVLQRLHTDCFLLYRHSAKKIKKKIQPPAEQEKIKLTDEGVQNHSWQGKKKDQEQPGSR